MPEIMLSEMIIKRIPFMIKVAGFIAVTLASCTHLEEKQDPFASDTYLTDTANLGIVSSSFIRITAGLAGHPEFNEYMKYPIQVYKIIYQTTYKGKPVLASGIVSYPAGLSDSIPVMLVGNGLIFANDEAPSEFDLPNHYTGFEFVGSMGYFTMIPDMLGFGISKDLLFPIHNYYYSAQTMIDFYHACKEFTDHLNLPVKQETYLSGYSQGGYIAVATLKVVEEDESSSIHIKAAAVGAGGYNLPALLERALESNFYSAPSHLALLLSSYNIVYDWNRPLTDFFNEPYAGEIPGLLGGAYTREEIDTHLPAHLDSLLNPIFLQKLKSGEETALIAALSENSVYDWAPHTTLRIVHSINDERIPFSDSEEMYNTMRKNGSVSVSLVPIDSEGHFNSGFTYMLNVIPWFDSLSTAAH